MKNFLDASDKIANFIWTSIRRVHLTKKDKFILITMVIIAVVSLISGLFNRRPPITSRAPTTVNLNDHTYRVLTAVTSAERQQGLMDIRKPVNFDGMQFIFPDRQTQIFWNQNTHFDLTIYWLQGDKVVGQIDLPSLDRAGLVTVYSPVPVDRVVEVIK